MGVKEEELEALVKRQETERQVFRDLLDDQRDKRNHHLAIRVKMGTTRSYITSVSLRWVAEHVRFAVDLPVWEKKKDETGRIIIDEETMEDLRQREPNWSRQLPMARYIAIRNYHKFPPILVAAWKDWVNDSSSGIWVGGHASEDSVTANGLDSKSAYVDLDCEETNFYALDGQHRLMAIRGLRDLLSDRRLERKNPNGSVRAGKGITLDSVIEEREMHSESKSEDAEAAIQSLMKESIGIEIIPAVLKNETERMALRRLRNIFVHVNLTAKPLTTGTLTQLDEDNGFAIVARRVMVKHALLKTKGRVLIGQGQVKDSSFEYTTLETLVTLAEKYLGKEKPYGGWYISEAGDLPFRPDDEELEGGVARLMDYFDLLATLPSHKELIQNHKKSSSDFRIVKAGEAPSDNILFRPIAQVALADAFHELVHGERKADPEKIMRLLIRAENGGMLHLRDKKSVWFGVLCDAVDQRMRKTAAYRQLCTRLMIHLLGGGTPEPDARGELLTEFRKVRRTADEKSCVGLNGEIIPENELELPAPW